MYLLDLCCTHYIRSASHDDVMTWEQSLHYWRVVREIIGHGANNAEHWCLLRCRQEQTVEQALQLSLIPYHLLPRMVQACREVHERKNSSHGLGFVVFCYEYVTADIAHIFQDLFTAWWRHQMETFFRVTGPLCGEFTGQRWIPCTKASDAELWCFLWSAPE